MKLIILGSGKLENELNKVIEAKELSNYVKIIPYSTNPFVYMNNAKELEILSGYIGGLNIGEMKEVEMSTKKDLSDIYDVKYKVY